MKRFLWLTVVLLASPCGFADSIPLFNITHLDIGFGVNFGGGENGAFSFLGPGTSIGGDAGTGCDWCFSGTNFLPGQSVDASIYFLGFSNYQVPVLGGQTLDRMFFSILDRPVTAGSFTFPQGAEQSTFIVTVPARFQTGLLLGNSAELGSFWLKVPPGKLTLTFNSFPDVNGYFFTDARFLATVPEPGTLVMVGSGLLVLGRRVFRRYC